MVLDLIERLCTALSAEGIDYCHWKSNPFLDRTASGDNDLDLLLNREHAQLFTRLLYNLGFKETLAAVTDDLPGVRNYYGYDRQSGRLFHVHAHFQLILGNDLSKNYRLPIERAYLQSACQQDLFRVPAPEYELVVLVIRMVLKHATWDSLLMRHGGLSSSERRELECLATPETLAKVDPVLAHMPGLDRNLFERCLRSVQPGASVLLQIRTGERLQKVLDSCARRPHLTDLAVKFTQRLWQPIQRRLFRYSPKSRFANGGLFIALVGGDGAGKTTMLDELSDWLSHEFEVQRLHMGKPEWSFATTLIRGMLKVGTLLHLYRFEGDIYEEASAPHGTPWFLRAACTARDRYLTYLRARRYSTNGGMVLCDRYSLPGFMNTDGPQCEQALRQAGGQSRFHSYLSELEASYYRRIDLPDLMIVLRLDPEIAVQRKVDETQLSVRARSTEVWKRDWSAVSASVVNADQPKEQVLSQIKDIVWAQL